MSCLSQGLLKTEAHVRSEEVIIRRSRGTMGSRKAKVLKEAEVPSQGLMKANAPSKVQVKQRLNLRLEIGVPKPRSVGG